MLRSGDIVKSKRSEISFYFDYVDELGNAVLLDTRGEEYVDSVLSLEKIRTPETIDGYLSLKKKRKENEKTSSNIGIILSDDARSARV